MPWRKLAIRRYSRNFSAADSGAGLADGAGLAGLAFAAALLADGADAFAAALLPDGADALGLDVTRGRFGAAGWVPASNAKEANGLLSIM